MGSGDGKSGGVELVFEVFGEVEAGGFGDFRWEFEVMVGSVEVGRVDDARNCGRSGKGRDGAVADDVVLQDASRRLRRRLIAWWNMGCRLLGLGQGRFLLQNLLLLLLGLLNWWLRSTVQCGRLTTAGRAGVAVGLLSVGGCAGYRRRRLFQFGFEL